MDKIRSNSVQTEDLLLAGIKWIAAGNILQRAFQLVTILILARILSPADFGVVATATLLVTFINMVKELGMPAALVQRQGDIEASANCFFFLSSFLALISYLGIFFLAEPVARFFRSSEIETVVQVMGLLFFIESSSVVHRTLASRNLLFKKQAVFTIVEAVFTALVSIFLGLNGWGLWAIVYGLLAGPSLGSILWWSRTEWRPQLRFDIHTAKSLLRFGGLVTVSNIFIHSLPAITRTFVGRFLGVAPLGIYDISVRFAYMPVRLLVVSVTQRVTFPALSRIQDDPTRIQDWYSAILKYTSFLMAPVSVFLFFAADHLVPVVLGPKWPEVTPILKVFSLGIFFLPLINARPVLLAAGKTRILGWLSVSRFVVTILVYFQAVQYGLFLLCVSEVGILILFAGINMVVVSRCLRIPLVKLCRVLIIPWKAVVVMGFSMIAIRLFMDQNGIEPNWISVLLLILPSVSTYLGIILLTYPEVGEELVEFLRTSTQKKEEFSRNHSDLS